MGSIGRGNISSEVRELEERLDRVQTPRHREKLVDDILYTLERTKEPGYDSERKSADQTVLKELLKRIRRGDYGEDNF